MSNSTLVTYVETLQVFAFKSPKIIGWGESVSDQLIKAFDDSNFVLQENDIINITSKVISMEELARIRFDEVEPSEKAIELSKISKQDPRFVQIVLNESNNEVYGAVFHAILAKTRYGLSANAGIDISNTPEGFALLLPRDPDSSAREIKNVIEDHYNISVSIIISDSRTIPLKKGTTAIALGIAGMEPLVDERGKEDLYGYKMSITTRAIADNTATATNLLMGETNERRPFAVLRGLKYIKSDKSSMQSTLMPEDQCLYYAPLFKLINEGEKSNN